MSKKMWVAVLGGVFLMLGGCVITVDPVDVPYAEVTVVSPPPAARVEYRAAPPGPGYVWIDGYWQWHRGRWVWVRGHWERPRAGYVWVAPRYEQRGGKYVYIQGGWVAKSGYRGATPSHAKRCPQGSVWKNGRCVHKAYPGR